jgi:hypothetical protein
MSGKLKMLRRGLKEWSKALSKLNKLIYNNSFVLAMLDGLEQQRALSVIERNFGASLKTHLISLLEAKRVYWRQRATIHWVKFGDENTKLFHSIATKNFRRNHIASLQGQDGSLASEHDHKVVILWNAFKDRLGQSGYNEMFFDLQTLNQSIDLSQLDSTFSIEEIDNIVKELPLEKAPGQTVLMECL